MNNDATMITEGHGSQYSFVIYLDNHAWIVTQSLRITNLFSAQSVYTVEQQYNNHVADVVGCHSFQPVAML